MRHSVCLVGHPFAPIGMGEHLRATFRALKDVDISLQVRDVYALNDPSLHDQARDIQSCLVCKISAPVRLFILNGDERKQAMAHLRNDISGDGFSIVYPAWELEKYPREWAELLDLYDEIWTSSRHTYKAISAAVKKPVYHLPLPGQPRVSQYISRCHFGIRDSAFAFLFCYDFTSYTQRKNPYAVIKAFQQLRARKPFEDCLLVIKVTGNDTRPRDYEELKSKLEPLGDTVIFIDKVLTDNEMKNLIRCCDCFISLHRAEGFGFNLAEAMYWGKPVIATGYSGNMDYMTEDTACLVDYKLIPVSATEYPYARGQVWADPDIAEAVDYMVRMIDDPAFCRLLGARASSHVRTYFSFRACGIRYLHRLETIERERVSSPASAM